MAENYPSKTFLQPRKATRYFTCRTGKRPWKVLKLSDMAPFCCFSLTPCITSTSRSRLTYKRAHPFSHRDEEAVALSRPNWNEIFMRPHSPRGELFQLGSTFHFPGGKCGCDKSRNGTGSTGRREKKTERGRIIFRNFHLSLTVPRGPRSFRKQCARPLSRLDGNENIARRYQDLLCSRLKSYFDDFPKKKSARGEGFQKKNQQMHFVWGRLLYYHFGSGD